MPYKSKAQQKWMHVHHPQMAKEWDKETEKADGFKKLPEHVKPHKRGKK